MRGIGIMQGRLSLPSNGKIQCYPKAAWQDEFIRAKEAGLSDIEWIFEYDEWEKNQLSSDSGIDKIINIIDKTGISIKSVCADYFMDIPYLTRKNEEEKKELVEKLRWLVNRVSKVGAKYIDLPFVDASKIPSPVNFDSIIEFITPALEIAEKENVIIALETDLNPKNFKYLLEMFNHPNLMANYDTGNSSGIGYDCIEELTTYGRWIKTVHIKDRLLGNGTKPLGTGSANFTSFFKELSKLNYTGPIVLQAAREVEGDEVQTAIKNRTFVQSYLRKYRI